eukprot:TRINITY_DN6962_c0_g1_i2.p1 TRINITY_DN6962_c0_g1~~TRINITY_DN6962_c0_g1_i2.p1  ORF type:complete len:596 (+),score=184.67 TRINITY_DN6962_c0_g1_i2:38-1789(+)
MSASSTSSSSSPSSSRLLPPSWHTPLMYAAGGAALAVAGAGMYVYANTDNIVEDFTFAYKLARMTRAIGDISSRKDYSVVDMFSDCVKRYPNKEAVVYVNTGETLTYHELDLASNQVAQWARSRGIGRGQVVALMMENRPAFISIWLGLAKAGATISFINTNVAGKALIHALTVCEAATFIVGYEHADVIGEAHEALCVAAPQHARNWFAHGGAIDSFASFEEDVAPYSQEALPRTVRAGIKPSDTLLYIYTSGTTGNPKASVISQRKFAQGALGFSFFCDLEPSDRVYTVLPLYHSAGGVGGVGMCWVQGATLVLRKKFSARKFWSDVKQHRASVLQYIGELCRYLLETPPSEADATHGARLMVGNGLRPDIWEQFQTRFNMPKIAELYAATEGNMGLINYKGKLGAVGFIAPLFRAISPVRIVRFDIENEEPIRGKDGFCIECAPDEPGELLGRIDPSKPSSTFEGYTDPAATEKKILRNVFEKGDMWFKSGDLLKQDKAGFFYFVDRIGDTFRWKGENVSTNEVAEILSAIDGVVEANVYGVAIPGRDGRAGMVALRVDPSSFNMDDFFQRCEGERAALS